MKPPEFTTEQIDWVCYKIGEWYLAWKSRMTDDGACHRLGVAKEQLKSIIFPAKCINCKENAVLWKGSEICDECFKNFGTDKFNYK